MLIDVGTIGANIDLKPGSLGSSSIFDMKKSQYF